MKLGVNITGSITSNDQRRLVERIEQLVRDRRAPLVSRIEDEPPPSPPHPRPDPRS